MNPSNRLQRIVRRLPGSLSGRLIRRYLHIDSSKVDGVVFKVAETQDELEAAFRLVHDVYLQEGYSDREESGMRVNLRYALPTSVTLIGIYQGKVVITASVIGDSPLGLPMDDIFSTELYELRRHGRSICEISALASDPSFRRRRQVVAMYMNHMVFNYARCNLGADDLVIAVNPKHEWVYKHLILFETISKRVKRYHYVNDAPAIAMRLDYRTAAERLRQAYWGRPPARSLDHFFFEHESPSVQLPATGEPHEVWSEELFSYFFEQRTDPRRDGYGTLLELYRVLYDLPESNRRDRRSVSLVYLDGTEPQPLPRHLDPEGPVVSGVAVNA